MTHSRWMLVGTIACMFMVSRRADAQYYIDTTVVLPVVQYRGPVFPIAMSTAREDVKSIGMGRTQIGNARQRVEMLANPALLAIPRTSFDVLNVQAGIPGQTLSAIDFVEANTIQFEQGIYLKEIKAGLDDFNNALTPEQYIAAIQRMNNGLKFVGDLINTVSGGQESPMTHGIRIIPMAQAQVGHFGFSLLATAQTGFQVASGAPLEELRNFKIPEGLSDPAAVLQAVQKVRSAVGALFDNFGNLAPDALPSVFAVSYIDIVASVGYGTHLTPELDGGIALKLVNRRFSTTRIPATDLGNLLTEAGKGFRTSTTGVTADIGFLYRLPKIGTRIALTAENVIPIQTIGSSISFDFAASAVVGYARTSYAPPGPIKVDAKGDTGLVAVRQPIQATIPMELKAPLVLTVGAQHPLAPNWDATFEWTDIASQVNLYGNLMERLRFGTEYRFPLIPNSVDVAGRIGFAQDHMTYGLGLMFFRIVDLDGAIAFDTFTKASSYYAQLRIGW